MREIWCSEDATGLLDRKPASALMLSSGFAKEYSTMFAYAWYVPL